ncbi:MAG: hypothetical protein AAGG51_17745 [Cyanobacteria bacterium P01_G01_bin.54]
MFHPALSASRQAAGQYQELREAVLADWPDFFPCRAPGASPRCLTCPLFGYFVTELQARIPAMTSEGVERDLLAWSMPQQVFPYEESLLAQGLLLFRAGMSLSAVQRLSGMGQRDFLRRRLLAAGLMKGLADCTGAEQARCLALVEQGWSLIDIEDETGIVIDHLQAWLSPEQWAVAKGRKYSEHRRRYALDIYQAGADNHTIFMETGIDPQTVGEWAKELGIRRPIVVQQGRRGIDYHRKRSEAARLQAEGYGFDKIGELLVVSSDTVRRWLREIRVS